MRLPTRAPRQDQERLQLLALLAGRRGALSLSVPDSGCASDKLSSVARVVGSVQSSVQCSFWYNIKISHRPFYYYYSCFDIMFSLDKVIRRQKVTENTMLNKVCINQIVYCNYMVSIDFV